MSAIACSGVLALVSAAIRFSSSALWKAVAPAKLMVGTVMDCAADPPFRASTPPLMVTAPAPNTFPPVAVVLLMQRWFVKGLVETEK